MFNEPYEAYVVAQAHLDSAIDALRGSVDEDEICADLHRIRNVLNEKRLALLGNGKERPFWVSDLNIMKGKTQ
jgi:hypothetical protein